MAEPHTTLASSGAALVTLATVVAGQVLGEYIIIILLGLLGTFIALTENSSSSFKLSLIFILKGVAFSFVFTGLITTLTLPYLPADIGLSPYAILGAVSFSIGWTSNKWDKIKDWMINLVTNRGVKS